MGEDGSKKLKAVFSIHEAAGFFQKLASGLEQGRLALGPVEQAVEGQVKIKAAIKAKGGKFSLKLKMKSVRSEIRDAFLITVAEDDGSVETPGVEVGDDDQPLEKKEYKKLKKRMKREFDDLGAALARGEMPPEDAVAAFLDDCRGLTAFEGYGDEHYLAFGALAAALGEAAEAGDLAAFEGFFQSMARMRDECHAAYK
ncbi:MAG: GAK system XXXCH domain-containing protein [Pseudomonadota bacterium]